ncbi:MAG: methyltransferase domain-containing protein [Planctomycetota bacterium]|nr:methyltransferase domain-containing protein [Planctomycetota bacterium]
MREHLRFLAGFAKAPCTVGAVAPSSRRLAELMTEEMGLREAETVVELGAGTGVFTRAIERHLGAGSVFLSLEVNSSFVQRLKSKFSRAEIVHDSAENIRQHLERHQRPHADSILSGLPWASFPPDLQERIMAAVVDALRPGGRFATFVYIHSAWLPAARQFRRWLTEHFASVSTTRVVWWNLPPAFVYRCEK